MLTLMILIFITFIGVGVPDSVLGTVWPAIYKEFNLPISLAGFIALTINFGTVISSLLSSAFLRRFGVGGVVSLSTAMTAFSLIGFALSPHPVYFFILALPLGLGSGCIDCSLNNFVATHYSATVMSMLHCFYGVGVALSPYLVSIALKGNSWRGGYLLVGAVQFIITIVTLFSLPLWKKAKEQDFKTTDDLEEETLSFITMLKHPAICMDLIVYFFQCAFELTAGGWFSTYIVVTQNIPMELAAKITTLFYIGLAFGRFMSGILAKRIDCWKIMFISTALLFVTVIFSLFSTSLFVMGILLFMFGFGTGPIYPNLTHLTPQNFGKKYSQSIINVQQASAYLGVMLMPAFFGLLADKFSVAIYPVVLFIYFILYSIALVILWKMLKKDIVIK